MGLECFLYPIPAAELERCLAEPDLQSRNRALRKAQTFLENESLCLGKRFGILAEELHGWEPALSRAVLGDRETAAQSGVWCDGEGYCWIPSAAIEELSILLQALDIPQRFREGQFKVRHRYPLEYVIQGTRQLMAFYEKARANGVAVLIYVS
jgi:hypothetical protein